MRVVLATGNRGKLAELAALLAPLGIEVEPRSRFGVEPPPETGATFLANALLKARHAAHLAQVPAIADDSGIEVDALDGAPGVYSARYAAEGAAEGGSEGAGDAANNAKLLAALADVPDERRTARYRCVLVYVRSADDPAPLVAEGQWEGRIARAPRGDGGFGYDPLFEVDANGRRAAELAPEEKNRRSHRGIALRELVTQLRATVLAPAAGPGPAAGVGAPGSATP
jgi:XTP/dITP diphosphohydrolase